MLKELSRNLPWTSVLPNVDLYKRQSMTGSQWREVSMFEGFSRDKKKVNGVSIAYRIGGSGPGLLLLHGHPQTHVMWHKVASGLAEKFTVVAADLRGYGDSDKPESDPQHMTYSKRIMGNDMVQLMQALGFQRFRVLAHDRGARVAHRMAVDHLDAVERMVLLDIAPTLAMYTQTSEGFARAYWHWFFLLRPTLPEKLISDNPEMYIRCVMGGRSAGLGPFTVEALAEYVRCLSQKGAAMGICEDYRASAGIDLEFDREDIAAGRKLACPLLVFWGGEGIIGKFFAPLDEWNKVAADVRGKALPSGHYIAEEIPDVLLKEAVPFLQGASDCF
jgi:haloacetate dehalogenase